MGIEYALKLSKVDRDRLDRLLRTHPQFASFLPEFDLYEFRGVANAGGMPDADAALQAYGLYFCDKGGEGQKILERLITKIENEYGQVTLEDLE